MPFQHLDWKFLEAQFLWNEEKWYLTSKTYCKNGSWCYTRTNRWMICRPDWPISPNFIQFQLDGAVLELKGIAEYECQRGIYEVSHPPPNTCRFLNLGCLHKVCSMSLLEGFETSPGPKKQVFVLNFAAVYFWGRHKHRKHSQTLGHILYSRHILEGYACDWRVMPCASQSKGHLFWSNLWQRIGLFWEMKIDVGSCWNENTSM